MSKALVTGAPGWLGNTFIRRLLKEGRSISLIVDPSFKNGDIRSLLPTHQKNQIDLTVCDLRELDTLKGALGEVSTVFHIAAVQHPAKVSDFYKINSEAAANLARIAALAGAKRFVFISSCSVQGSSDRPSEESTPLTGYTHYTLSKIKAEELLAQVADQTGIEIVIIRPGVFYGREASANMKRLMQMVQTKTLPMFGSDGFKRTYVDVEKVSEALLLAEAKAKSGTAYLIGDLEPLTTKELYETLGQALGCRPKILPLPVIVSRLAETTTFEIGKALGMHIRMGNIMGEFGRPTYFQSTNSASLGFEPLASSRPGLTAMAKHYLETQ